LIDNAALSQNNKSRQALSTPGPAAITNQSVYPLVDMGTLTDGDLPGRNGKAFAERMTIGVIKILSVFHQIAFTELKLLHFGFGVALQKGDSSIAALVVINHPFEKRGVFRGFYGQPDTASAGNRRGSAGSIY